MVSTRIRLLLALALLLGSATSLRAQPTAAPTAAPMAAPTAALDSAELPRGQRRVSLSFATRFLERGETLRPDDFVRRDTVINWRWGMVSPDTTRVSAGWMTRRPIAAGEVLRPPAVMPPPVITSGATVSAVYQDGPVRVVIAGTATNTAAVGAPVGVRIDRARRLDGVAVGPNIVRLR